ncbi:MAG: hypothetical protein AAFQ04_03735, partial [Pseudomonadota bacterium]
MNVKPDFNRGKNYAENAPAYLSVWDMQSYYGESYIVIALQAPHGQISRRGFGVVLACGKVRFDVHLLILSLRCRSFA